MTTPGLQMRFIVTLFRVRSIRQQESGSLTD